MAFAMGQKVILKMNDVQVGIGEVVWAVQTVDLHVMVKYLSELWGVVMVLIGL